jgi:Na+/melibiose symporter-like transporter
VSNDLAGYWFGLFYVLFYLSDTFTNIPYEALGPELHNDTHVRTKQSTYTCCSFFHAIHSLASQTCAFHWSIVAALPDLATYVSEALCVCALFIMVLMLCFGSALMCTELMQEREKLFFFQKLVNMMGMIVAAISPALIALLWRNRTYEEVNVECDYVFHSDSNDTHILHGTIPDQLLYVDDHSTGITLNKTAEFCESGAGNFCFEVRRSAQFHSLP